MVKALSVMREGTCRHMCTRIAPIGDRAGHGATPASTQQPPPCAEMLGGAQLAPILATCPIPHSSKVCLQGGTT